jgi:hypothetical protein
MTMKVTLHDEEARLLVAVATAHDDDDATVESRRTRGTYLSLLHPFGGRIFGLMQNFSNGGGKGGGVGGGGGGGGGGEC